MTLENPANESFDPALSQQLLTQLHAIRREQRNWFQSLAADQKTLESLQYSVAELQNMVKSFAGLQPKQELKIPTRVGAAVTANSSNGLSDWEVRKQKILQEEFGVPFEPDSSSSENHSSENHSEGHQNSECVDAVELLSSDHELHDDFCNNVEIDHPEIDELKHRLEEKIRETEIALSLERAEIGRQRAALDDEMHRYSLKRAELEKRPTEKRGFFKRLSQKMFPKTKGQIAEEKANQVTQKLAKDVSTKKRISEQAAEKKAADEAARIVAEEEARAAKEQEAGLRRRRKTSRN